MEKIQLDRESLTASFKMHGVNCSSKVEKKDYPYFVGYKILDVKFAIKTSNGSKLHCAHGEIQTKRVSNEAYSDEDLNSKLYIDFDWNGARGNGFGKPSKLSYIGNAKDFKIEDFSKQTQKTREGL